MKTTWALPRYISNKSRCRRYLGWGGGARENVHTKKEQTKVFELKSELIYKVYSEIQKQKEFYKAD